jgi:hypothetical protein
VLYDTILTDRINLIFVVRHFQMSHGKNFTNICWIVSIPHCKGCRATRIGFILALLEMVSRDYGRQKFNVCIHKQAFSSGHM